MIAPLAAIALTAAVSGAVSGADAGPSLEPWPQETRRIAPWPAPGRMVEIDYVRGRILAPVRIEGAGETLFILDTAAGTSLIAPDLRDRLDLEPGQVRRQRVRGATGEIELDYVRLPGLVFGGERQDGVWAVVADLDEFHGGEAAGVLGVDVLSRFDLRLDLARGVLELSPPAGAAGRGVAFHSRSQAGFVEFTASINGAPVAAVLDTGARSGTLNWAAAGLAGLTPGGDAVRRTGLRSAGVDGVGVETAQARVDGLCVGRACFNGAPVRIADLAVFAHVGADGGAGPSMLVGADMLALCPADILYSQGVLRLCAD